MRSMLLVAAPCLMAFIQACTSCGSFWREDEPGYRKGSIDGWEEFFVTQKLDTACDHCSTCSSYNGSLISYDSISLTISLAVRRLAQNQDKHAPIFFAPAFACDPDIFLTVDNPIRKMEIISTPAYSGTSGGEQVIDSLLTVFHRYDEIHFPDFQIDELDTIHESDGLLFRLLAAPVDTNKFVFRFKMSLMDDTEHIVSSDTLYLY